MSLHDLTVNLKNKIVWHFISMAAAQNVTTVIVLVSFVLDSFVFIL